MILFAFARGPHAASTNPLKTYSIWLPLMAASISACGQILLKYAMSQVGPLNFSPVVLLRALQQPFLPIALVVYAFALVLWLEVLSKTPLSVAYPVLAVTYVIVPFISQFVFNERIEASHYLGMFLILAGVALIGR
jgi:undecaprenyl phosphate-alpha-L-ara4N flippase subunit ArnE